MSLHVYLHTLTRLHVEVEIFVFLKKSKYSLLHGGRKGCRMLMNEGNKSKRMQEFSSEKAKTPMF